MAERQDFGLEQLQALLDSYGANRARWPTGLRTAAEALIDRDPEARAALAEAQRLDDLLSGASDPLASPELKARVLADASARRRFRLPRSISFGPFWKPAATLAAAAILGVALGVLVEPPLPTTAELSVEGEIGELALSSLYDAESQQ